MPHVFGEAQGHFERVGAVIVRAGWKIAQLIHEQSRRRRAGQKPQSVLRQVRSEPANSHEFAGLVVNRRRNDVADALPGELGGKLAAEQLLKLIGLNAERGRPKA